MIYGFSIHKCNELLDKAILAKQFEKPTSDKSESP